MTDRTLLNARRPEQDEYGAAVLERMNISHYGMTQWGLSHVVPASAKAILDVGCGGGRTLRGLLETTEAFVCGVDFSAASVEKTLSVNSDYVAVSRAEVIRATAEAIPYPDSTFDLVTAFETTYYWPFIVDCFREVRRVLRPGGEFLICNEDRDLSRSVVAENYQALGMTLYTSQQLGALLAAAGFAETRTFDHENGLWICAVGKK